MCTKLKLKSLQSNVRLAQLMFGHGYLVQAVASFYNLSGWTTPKRGSKTVRRAFYAMLVKNGGTMREIASLSQLEDRTWQDLPAATKFAVFKRVTERIDYYNPAVPIDFMDEADPGTYTLHNDRFLTYAIYVHTVLTRFKRALKAIPVEQRSPELLQLAVIAHFIS